MSYRRGNTAQHRVDHCEITVTRDTNVNGYCYGTYPGETQEYPFTDDDLRRKNDV